MNYRNSDEHFLVNSLISSGQCYCSNRRKSSAVFLGGKHSIDALFCTAAAKREPADDDDVGLNIIGC